MAARHQIRGALLATLLCSAYGLSTSHVELGDSRSASTTPLSSPLVRSARANTLSYPTALAGAPGLGLPSPFRHRDVFLAPSPQPLTMFKSFVTPRPITGKIFVTPRAQEPPVFVTLPPETTSSQRARPQKFEPPRQETSSSEQRTSISQNSLEVLERPGDLRPQGFQLPARHAAQQKYKRQQQEQYVASSEEVETSNESDEGAKYEFMYHVEDRDFQPVESKHGEEDVGIPSDFGHSEARKGDSTWGRYFVKLPDGRVQTVRYWADHSGYHAEVKFEGTAQHPEPYSADDHLPEHHESRNHVSQADHRHEKRHHVLQSQQHVQQPQHHVQQPRQHETRQHHIQQPLQHETRQHHVQQPQQHETRQHHVQQPQQHETRQHYVQQPKHHETRQQQHHVRQLKATYALPLSAEKFESGEQS